MFRCFLGGRNLREETGILTALSDIIITTIIIINLTILENLDDG